MIKKIFALPVIEQISPVLSRRKLDELDLIVVDHPQVKASFALQGAHLLSWKPAGEEEVLWLSNNTPFKQGVALRGGVPICWPWFGPSAQQGLPSHGFARNLRASFVQCCPITSQNLPDNTLPPYLPR